MRSGITGLQNILIELFFPLRSWSTVACDWLVSDAEFSFLSMLSSPSLCVNRRSNVKVVSCSGISRSSVTQQIYPQREMKRPSSCLCRTCESPSACPRSEGNPPRVEARTSPGLRLEGLEEESGRRKKKKSIRLSQSASFTSCHL